MRKHYKIDLPIYCDMDGVLADFFAVPNAVENYTKDGFFRDLPPMEKNIQTIKQLIADGNTVYILSATPHAKADYDKKHLTDKEEAGKVYLLLHLFQPLTLNFQSTKL